MLSEIDDADCVGEAANGREAIDRFNALQPDIVLMDIRMPLMDGLEAAHYLGQLDVPPAVVFCTAYDEHALAAFEASAVDYIVKPVRSERLASALDKARLLTAGARQSLPQPDQRSHLCANHRGGLELVAVNTVICLIAEHKYVTAVHAAGEVLLEESLKSLESEFADRFLRIHRNALVAVNHITGLSKNSEGHSVVTLRDTDRTLEVSRRNLAHVRQILKTL